VRGGLSAALLRYRVLAYVVGTLLVVLVFVGVPLSHFAGRKGVSSVVAPLHGWLFVVYLVAMVDLARRTGWDVKRMLLIAVAGVVPFLTFWVERQVTRDVLARTR
jgi:integral membrane protein